MTASSGFAIQRQTESPAQTINRAYDAMKLKKAYLHTQQAEQAKEAAARKTADEARRLAAKKRARARQ